MWHLPKQSSLSGSRQNMGVASEGQELAAARGGVLAKAEGTHFLPKGIIVTWVENPSQAPHWE